MTNNLERRLREHNSGKNFYTKRYIPWSLVYSEEFSTVQEAKKREVYLKTAAGREFLKTIFEDKTLGGRLMVGQRPLKP